LLQEKHRKGKQRVNQIFKLECIISIILLMSTAIFLLAANNANSQAKSYAITRSRCSWQKNKIRLTNFLQIVILFFTGENQKSDQLIKIIMLQPKLFLLALGFFTRLPGPQSQDYTKLPQAVLYLPLVGWLVGSITAVSFYLADFLWPQTTAVILALITGIFLTGAFHEDGFADVCDGFGGGWGKQRILEIMKDSFVGVYGFLGLLLIFLLKISLLSGMFAGDVPLILLAGHSISRLPPLLLMYHYNYARTYDSKSQGAVYKPNSGELAFATVIALLPVLLLPVLCVSAVMPVLAVNWYLGHYFHRHIGGYTGDCLGASQQIAETVFYLSVSVLWTFI